MSYRSDAEKLQMFLNAIQEMTSIAVMLAEKEGELYAVQQYLKYVALRADIGAYIEDYENWNPSDYSENFESWNSSSC